MWFVCKLCDVKRIVSFIAWTCLKPFPSAFHIFHIFHDPRFRQQISGGIAIVKARVRHILKRHRLWPQASHPLPAKQDKTSKKPERCSGRRFASAIMFLCSSLCQCANTLLWYTIMWYQHAESNSSEFSLFVLIALWSHPECCKSFDISHASLITSHHPIKPAMPCNVHSGFPTLSHHSFGFPACM